MKSSIRAAISRPAKPTQPAQPTQQQRDEAAQWLAKQTPSTKPLPPTSAASSIYLQPDAAPSYPLPKLTSQHCELAEDSGLFMVEDPTE